MFGSYIQRAFYGIQSDLRRLFRELSCKVTVAVVIHLVDASLSMLVKTLLFDPQRRADKMILFALGETAAATIALPLTYPLLAAFDRHQLVMQEHSPGDDDLTSTSAHGIQASCSYRTYTMSEEDQRSSWPSTYGILVV